MTSPSGQGTPAAPLAYGAATRGAALVTGVLLGGYGMGMGLFRRDCSEGKVDA